jgi:hypothetical protein
MKIDKQKRSQHRFGYYIVIEIESREDEASIKATLDYLVAKKDKRHHASKGKLIMLPKMLREVID